MAVRMHVMQGLWIKEPETGEGMALVHPSP